jgi:hypothetical protein
MRTTIIVNEDHTHNRELVSSVYYLQHIIQNSLTVVSTLTYSLKQDVAK